MTDRAEITRMAREAGHPYPQADAGFLEAFAALVEAAERERWAKFLENHESSGYSNLPHELAAAIRANKDAP